MGVSVSDSGPIFVVDDDSADFTHSQFDQQTLGTKENPYGKKLAKGKSFRTREFAGAYEYKHGDYQFLKRQEYKAETARDQDQLFGQGATESAEAKKRFFWRRKRARTKEFGESEKDVRTREYYETKRSLERLEGRDLNIVEDPARDAGVAEDVVDL